LFRRISYGTSLKLAKDGLMMNHSLTEDTKAIILLCGIFGKDRSEKPLLLREYSSLVRWLIEKRLRPADLLQKENILDAAIGSGIDKERLESLLGRGIQLGFAVEEWQRNGIWIISRSDSDYPARYKKHLKDKAPPLLYGVGDRSLLKGGGLAIIGSRNVDQAGEAFTRQAAELCANNEMPVVSGGARGVDQVSMSAALEAGGTVIGILAENLMKKSLERSARKAIANGQLLLISPYHPNARFTVGTAMGRNKLIYAMSDLGLVVSSEYKKGGTWAGAEEELSRDISIPTFVRVGHNAPEGNSKLLDIGAIPWPESINLSDFKKQLFDLGAQASDYQQKQMPSLFSFQEEDVANVEEQQSVKEPTHKEKPAVSPENKSQEPHASIYQAVLPIILNSLDRPMTSDQIAELLNVNKTQLNEWLKKAINDNKIIKLSKPVRYKRQGLL